MTDKYVAIGGFCPACGGKNTILAPRHATLGVLHCSAEGCPDKMAAAKILSEPEIHHVVNFNGEGYFNVKHPLRERIDDQLLNCEIHDVIIAECQHYGVPGKGPWRIRKRDDVPGEEANEWPWLWERIG